VAERSLIGVFYEEIPGVATERHPCSVPACPGE